MTATPPQPVLQPIPDDTATSDADRLASAPPTTCLNCGATLPGQFCPDCGQRDQPLRQPAHRFIAESVSEYFGLDGRLWRTLKLLLVRPGALTVAYLDGRRAHYLRPLRIYLTATVLFFFLLSFQDPFEIRTETLQIEAVVVDSLTVDDIKDALDDRRRVADTEVEAYETAHAALSKIGRGSQVVTPESVLVTPDSLKAVHDRLRGLSDDSVLAITSLPDVVVASLRDSSTVDVPSQMNTIIEDRLIDALPTWVKGDLARQLENAESESERRVLNAQVQRAVLRQIPTTLFVVLPIFALLLKLLYVFGMGRSPRRRVRPLAPSTEAGWLGRWSHQVRLALWRFQHWRAFWRAKRRRRTLARARARRIRGLPRRLRLHVSQHSLLRRWRVRNLAGLRRSLRMERNPYYAEHLVFALHVHSFAFVVFAGLLVASVTSAPAWVVTVLSLSIPLYFLLAQKRVYAQPWLTTLLKSGALAMAYSVVLGLGILLAGALALRLG